MTDAERLQVFSKDYIYLIHHRPYKHLFPIKGAVTSFALDIGIFDTREIDNDLLEEVISVSGPTAVHTDLYHLLCAKNIIVSDNTFLKILTGMNYKDIPGKYNSDLEAFICNIARLYMIDNEFQQYLMIDAICLIAQDLGIITEEQRAKLLHTTVHGYSYYSNLDWLCQFFKVDDDSKKSILRGF